MGAVDDIIPLRAYQREALDAVFAARDRGVSRVLLSLPTGSGKTYTAAHLIREAALPRTLFMVHRDELVRQSVAALRRVNPALSLGVIKADQDDIWAEIVVASAQTLARSQRLGRYQRAIAGAPLLFISDECHHDAAPTRRNIIDTLAPELLVGLTATARRGDGVGLGGVYEEIAFHLSMLELIAMGKLARLKGLRIDTEEDLDQVHTRAGELAENELAGVVNTPGRNALIVESWKRHASGRKRTVAFCVDVRHAEALAQAFRDEGVRAETILGTTPAEERQRILGEFHRGEVPVLTNCMVLTEGYDEPAIDCVLMARPTKSSSLYVQCVGRGARISPETGKADCLVIDYMDNTSRHSLVTLPVLAGLEAPDGDPAADTAKAEADREQGELLDLFDYAVKKKQLRERSAQWVNLFGASQYRWQPMPDGMTVAPRGKNAWLAIVPAGAEFVPWIVARLENNDFKASPLFSRPVDAETAMSLAEAKAPLDALTSKEAAWRSAPASDQQREAARKWRLSLPARVTRGEASDALSLAMFKAAAKRAHLSERTNQLIGEAV
jgi:superfamily II DNA or RNA helicase